MENRMSKPGPIDNLRIRKVKGSFSRIEHRFINGRYIDLLDPREILVYFFLVTVGDSNGVSYYSRERMAGILKTSVESIEMAIGGLEEKEFIACRRGIYQVLDLPE
jgi:hypothetical protein